MSHGTCGQGAIACALLLGALGAGCTDNARSEGGALVVRQVLSTAEQPANSAGEVTLSAPSPVPGMSLGSTLVADSPRAIYRRAYDQSRRRADGDSPRERIAGLDAAIDESEAAAQSQTLLEEPAQ